MEPSRLMRGRSPGMAVVETIIAAIALGTIAGAVSSSLSSSSEVSRVAHGPDITVAARPDDLVTSDDRLAFLDM